MPSGLKFQVGRGMKEGVPGLDPGVCHGHMDPGMVFAGLGGEADLRNVLNAPKSHLGVQSPPSRAMQAPARSLTLAKA